MKKVKQFLVALAMLVMFIIPVNVSAASKAPTCEPVQNVYFFQYFSSVMGMNYSDCIFIKNIKKNAEISNYFDNKGVHLSKFTSENGAPILHIRQWDGEKNAYTVKFDVKQDGKIYHLKCKLVKKPVPLPFKSIKIGGKEYAAKYISSLQQRNISKKFKFTKSKSAKITIVPKSDYKLTGIQVESKMIKNGGKADLSADKVHITIYFREKNPKKAKYFNSLQYETIKNSYRYQDNFIYLAN